MFKKKEFNPFARVIELQLKLTKGEKGSLIFINMKNNESFSYGFENNFDSFTSKKFISSLTGLIKQFYEEAYDEKVYAFPSEMMEPKSKKMEVDWAWIVISKEAVEKSKNYKVIWNQDST